MIGWQWHQLDHMQIICTTFQTDNHARTPSLSVLQAGCSSWRPTNSVKENAIAGGVKCAPESRMQQSAPFWREKNTILWGGHILLHRTYPHWEGIPPPRPHSHRRVWRLHSNAFGTRTPKPHFWLWAWMGSDEVRWDEWYKRWIVDKHCCNCRRRLFCVEIVIVIVIFNGNS